MPPVFLEKLVIDGREYEVKTDGTFKLSKKLLMTDMIDGMILRMI